MNKFKTNSNKQNKEIVFDYVADSKILSGMRNEMHVDKPLKEIQ
jgi:hypothetical protein